ncbi:protein-tyrosine phosphatase [Sinobaca qinghaiensis]|uniref:Protein-tyrosine phosphatase n=1 Tax=Sinobaca qinghaiensis TaxID=342944 RepID=A0A419V7R8_9BACL|nr:low molecular weight protein arginine phosphatase [Sinobaca qinghaiensis]RKD76080.1 protein-tyrosine phosphatase [Sinobaca qinghaiensis]
MKHVLFVCTGNTCRSPLAEALLLHKNEEEIEVRSAGVYAADGVPPSVETLEVLKEKNISYQETSNLLTKEMIDWADIVLTMTVSHKQAAAAMYPYAADRIYTLHEFALDDKGRDIMDPIGADTDVYRQTAAEIERLMDHAIPKIKSL